MNSFFYSLQDLYQWTHSVTFILIPVVFIGLLGFWVFLTGRDEDIDKF